MKIECFEAVSRFFKSGAFSNGGHIDALQKIDLFFQLQKLISDRRSTHTKPKGYQILDFLKLDWMLGVSDPLRIPFDPYKTSCKMYHLLSVSKFAVFEKVGERCVPLGPIFVGFSE